MKDNRHYRKLRNKTLLKKTLKKFRVKTDEPKLKFMRGS